ncbi:DUF6602 domain-containing protein [Herpetosiphon llansteffanensis]
MPRYFTHYWTNQTWDVLAQTEQDQLLDYTASNLFLKRGIQVGDYVYVLTVKEGLLYLLGAMLVGEICDAATAAKRLNMQVDEIWPADDHLLAQQATLMNFKQRIPDQVVRALRFNSAHAQKPLFFKANGLIDQQTLRGVRELTPDSAQLLTDYHSAFQDLPIADYVPASMQGAKQMSPNQSKSTSLLGYYESINEEFKAIKNQIRLLLGDTKHWLSDGEHKEAILRKILRQHVPEIMRIGTGFVSFPNGNGSTQQDILITDSRKPTLFKDHDLTIVTSDAVRAIIEVKSKQTKTKLLETLTKLANNIADIRYNSEPDTRCFAGLFIYEEPQIDPKIILQVLHEAVANHSARVIDFVAFGSSMFIQFSHRPFLDKSAEFDSWYLYDLDKNLAPAYFISHIAWHLTEQRSQMNRQAYFPLGTSIIDRAQFYLSLNSSNGIPQKTLNQDA